MTAASAQEAERVGRTCRNERYPNHQRSCPPSQHPHGCHGIAVSPGAYLRCCCCVLSLFFFLVHFCVERQNFLVRSLQLAPLKGTPSRPRSSPGSDEQQAYSAGVLQAPSLSFSTSHSQSGEQIQIRKKLSRLVLLVNRALCLVALSTQQALLLRAP